MNRWYTCFIIIYRIQCMYLKLISFSPIAQFVDIVQYLCRNALKDVIPEFFALHHLPITPINHSELHPIFTLVQLPPVYLLCRSDKKLRNTKKQKKKRQKNK